jgi:hypothetical protein
MVAEIEGRLRSQRKLLGKIVGVMCPPLFGCRTNMELCRVRGWDKNLPSHLLGALPKRSWLKRLRRLGLEVLIPLWRHAASKSKATRSRWPWTWVGDDSVSKKYGEQLGLVGTWWSGQEHRVLPGMDGGLLVVVIGDGKTRGVCAAIPGGVSTPIFIEISRLAFRKHPCHEEMVFVEGHYLLALDGTGYFSSNQMHCASCLETHHRHGTITYRHQMLGAALIHPDQRAVTPLMPEPILKHDGTDKNDCERNAAQRLIIKLRQDHPHLPLIVTEDSLSSNAPHIQLLHDHHLHYILGVKEGDHAYLSEHVAAAERAGRVTCYDRDDPATGLRHRFRFVSDVPLNASHADLRVTFLECWEWDKDTVQHLSWVTDLRVNKGTVYQLMRGGRARWRIENETCNTLKNQGYHFEHNVGHGYQHLSVVFAILMMLAFVVNQVQQLCCPLFQAVWAKLGTKSRLWEKRRALFYDYALESMRQLFEALLYGWQKAAPILVLDSS